MSGATLRGGQIQRQGSMSPDDCDDSRAIRMRSKNRARGSLETGGGEATVGVRRARAHRKPKAAAAAIVPATRTTAPAIAPSEAPSVITEPGSAPRHGQRTRCDLTRYVDSPGRHVARGVEPDDTDGEILGVVLTPNHHEDAVTVGDERGWEH